MISRCCNGKIIWNFTQWPSRLSGARGGLLLFLPQRSDFSSADCSRAMFDKSKDYGNDMMVVQFFICFSLSCTHDFPRNFSQTVHVIVKKKLNNNFPWTVLLSMLKCSKLKWNGEWFHYHVQKSINHGKLLLISLMYTVFTATVN